MLLKCVARCYRGCHQPGLFPADLCAPSRARARAFAPPGGLNVRQQQVVGNLQRIRAVVKHHVAQADETRTGQFLAAAAKGEADRVKLLLQQGYNPNTCDYDKRTALMLAAAHGHKVSPGAAQPWSAVVV